MVYGWIAAESERVSAFSVAMTDLPGIPGDDLAFLRPGATQESWDAHAEQISDGPQGQEAPDHGIPWV